MKLDAVGAKILVQMDKYENEISNEYHYLKCIGTVISTGEYVDMVEQGDRVLLVQYSGTVVVIDGCEFSIVTEDDILCVVIEEKK